MTLSQNMIFFDLNYTEFASITGTNLNTATAIYGYDNRSDSDLVAWNTTTGSYVSDFGSGTYFYITDIFINNHNFQNFNIQINTGTAWTTQTAYTNQTISSHHISFATATVYDAQVSFTTTQDGGNGTMGEFIVTKQKFQLNYNPDKYIPRSVPVGANKSLITGLRKFNPRNRIFDAKIGWSFLQGDSNTLTNTDLQNVTELARKNTTFLFWPNAGNDFVNMYNWRSEDLFKCKIIEAVEYEFPASNLDYIIKADYTIREVQ